MTNPAHNRIETIIICNIVLVKGWIFSFSSTIPIIVDNKITKNNPIKDLYSWFTSPIIKELLNIIIRQQKIEHIDNASPPICGLFESPHLSWDILYDETFLNKLYFNSIWLIKKYDKDIEIRNITIEVI